MMMKKIKNRFPFLRAQAGGCAFAALTAIATPGLGQTNSIRLSSDELRDSLYDAATASALSQAPIHAAVLYLMDEAMRRNPGVLSAADVAAVMQSVIDQLTTNGPASSQQLTIQDLSSRALPYLQAELATKLPPDILGKVANGWPILLVAEQQGMFSAVYSNLITALPSGALFSDAENTAASIQGVLYRQAATRVVALALPERIRTSASPAFRNTAAQVASRLTSVTPGDDVNSIAQTVAAFRSTPFVQQLVQKAGSAPQPMADVQTVLTNLTQTLAALHQVVTNNATGLGLDNAETNAPGISSAIADGVTVTQPLVNLASALVKLGGDPNLAQEVATVGGAAIRVAKAVEGVSDAIGGEEGLFSLTGSIATGNLIGAALDVFSIFGGGSTAPNPNQVILEQISAVRQDIANLGRNMNARFDQVDSALTNIMAQLDYNLSLTTNGLVWIEGNLGQIRVSLLDLQGQVHRLESDTYSWLNVIGDRPLQEALNIGLGYETTYGTPLPYTNNNQNFVTYENTFYTWAVNNSTDLLSEPNGGDYTIFPGLYFELTTNAPENNMAYINEFAASGLGQPKPFYGVLANPRAWSVTANAYSQLCVENPAWFRLVAKLRLGDIIEVGNDLQSFLNNLIGTGAPNTNLWIAACNGYRGAVQAFTNAIQGSLDSFNETNGWGLPAGFNPFTNQFLSVVTPPVGCVYSSIGRELAIPVARIGADWRMPIYLAASSCGAYPLPCTVTPVLGTSRPSDDGFPLRPE
jgi:hypothetical protein